MGIQAVFIPPAAIIGLCLINIPSGMSHTMDQFDAWLIIKAFIAAVTVALKITLKVPEHLFRVIAIPSLLVLSHTLGVHTG